MPTEAPAVIKFGQRWKPFANEKLKDSPEEDIISPVSELEDLGIVKAKLIPLESDQRFWALPFKELKKGRDRFTLEDRSSLYLVRIILTTEEGRLTWEDKGEGISTLNCTLSNETSPLQPFAKGASDVYYPSDIKNATESRKLDIAFDRWLIDRTQPDYDYESETPNSFNLLVNLDTARELEFIFGNHSPRVLPDSVA